MPNKTTSPTMLCVLAAAPLYAGCSQAPNVPILGAFFPGWMLCALLGIALAVVIRGIVAIVHRGGPIDVSPLLYPALALLCAALGWILFFRGGA